MAVQEQWRAPFWRRRPRGKEGGGAILEKRTEGKVESQAQLPGTVQISANDPTVEKLPSPEATFGICFALVSVSAAMHLDAGGLGLLFCFMGVLVGANLLVAGIRMADGPAPNPIVPVVLGGARALAAFMRRNTAAVGLVMASCAVTVLVSGEARPVLCFATFALLLLGVSLISISISIGARGE